MEGECTRERARTRVIVGLVHYRRIEIDVHVLHSQARRFEPGLEDGGNKVGTTLKFNGATKSVLKYQFFLTEHFFVSWQMPGIPSR